MLKKTKIASLARALTTPVRSRPMVYEEQPPSTRRVFGDLRSVAAELQDDGPLTIRP